MSLAAAWNEQYEGSAKYELDAVATWCGVSPSPDDWREWLSTMPQADTPWQTSLFAALGQDKDLWHDFMVGAFSQGFYQNNPMALLDPMRVRGIETGKMHEPLPLGCLEAMAEMASATTPQWKANFLFRTPGYWFGEPQTIDPASTQPLHELGVALLSGCELETRKLPSLAWSPSSIYDDYGSVPDSVKSMVAPIQHALEYAVYTHQVKQDGPDQLAHAEVYGYFERYNLSLSAFETLVDLSQAKPTLGSYIRVLHSMLSPEAEQYHVDLSDDSPQP